MNDALKILGVLVLGVVFSIALTGKSTKEIVSTVREDLKNSDKSTKILALDGHVPPAWLGDNTAVDKKTDTVIDNQSGTNSETVFVSNEIIPKKDRSNFKNSATNDEDNGSIVIASRNTRNSIATASVIQANSSLFNNESVSYIGLLVIVVMLIILVFLARIVGRKHKQKKYRQYRRPLYQNQYSRPAARPYSPYSQQQQKYH